MDERQKWLEQAIQKLDEQEAEEESQKNGLGRLIGKLRRPKGPQTKHVDSRGGFIIIDSDKE